MVSEGNTVHVFVGCKVPQHLGHLATKNDGSSKNNRIMQVDVRILLSHVPHLDVLAQINASLDGLHKVTKRFFQGISTQMVEMIRRAQSHRSRHVVEGPSKDH